MTWEKGKWKVICDVCGWEFYSDEVKKRWDGLLVCEKDFEHDHPQKYLRVNSDPKPLPADWIRVEPEDTFVSVCTVIGTQGVAGFSVAGCAVTGKSTYIPNYSIV